MIKILMINTVRYKLNGISSVIMNYYKNMDKDSLEFHFISIGDMCEEYKEFFESNNLKIFEFKRKNPLNYFLNIYKLAKSNQYDIVHVHGNSSTMAVELLACKLAGVKVRIAHSHNTTTAHPFVHKSLYPLFKSSYTHGFACGEEAGKWLFKNDDFIEIKNGINLKQYAFDRDIRNTYRSKINVEDEIVIGHVGNFVEQKNHTFILDLFNELIKENNKYKLLLISDGYLFEDMKQKAKDLGIEDSVIFLGKTTEVYNYLMAMDVFILPSLYEGFPVVLVEAQASGIQCIVSDKVDKKVNFVDLVDFLPIDNTQEWVKYLLDLDLKENRDLVSKKNIETMIQNGFDIYENAKIMKQLYIDYTNRNK